MEQNEQKTTTIIVAVMVTVVLIAGFYFLKPASEETTVTEETGGIVNSKVINDADALFLINQVNTITLDSKKVSDLTNNTTFVGLVDTTVQIEQEEVRRENPFSSI